MILLFVFIF